MSALTFDSSYENNLKRIEEKSFTEQEIFIVSELLKDSLIYTAALKELQTKIEILREDYRRNNAYNPIEHIKTRIKQPSSILRKIYTRGWPLDIETIQENMSDIAGIRIVCTFKKDIYEISRIIQDAMEIEVVQIKDYIANPKPSGYQSLHMIVNVPVYFIDGKKKCKVEIQLRTMAMDFWASLEHKIKYKYNSKIPEDIEEELRNSAYVCGILDDTMQQLHMKVHNPNENNILE